MDMARMITTEAIFRKRLTLMYKDCSDIEDGTETFIKVHPITARHHNPRYLIKYSPPILVTD
jgi:hypothetical protein